MSEDPINIAREAKSIHQSLKELLKTKEPFDRDVEFQRKNLRKRCLNLLLLHPYAKESKDAETHLWMQTSYAFISSYKHRISHIDRAIQANARQPDNPKQQQNQKQNVHGPVEYRKLLQRFRQFLAEEEKFWIQLVLRMHRSFVLNEADSALETLGIITETTGNEIAAELASTANPIFPNEPPGSQAPGNQAERYSRLSIMSKALICLGDIARYRELYNESGGRPRAGHEAGAPARRGKIRKKGTTGIDAVPMARNYDRAQQRYEQARLLVPYEGNASHQLAIVASYLPDALVSLTHYYRALCVKHPYEPAAENMAIHMTKTLQLWNRSKHEREQILGSESPSILSLVDIFKARMVVLHALWRKNMDKEVKEQERRIYEEFHRLVGERNLPSDTICNVVVLSQGALWKHRMIRDANSTAGQARHETVRSPEANVILEWWIFQHLLDVHIALLEVGVNELKELPSMENVDNDLAQRITATFRRTLPALRIASKWLRGNLSYVIQDPEFKAYQQKEKSKGGRLPQKTPGKISGHSNRTVRFWNRYTRFMSSLAQAFPEDRLVSLTHPLEEDIDMRGFLPLKKVGDEHQTKDNRTPERAHPNEEQLMRIFDLLTDAKAMVETQNSPIEYRNGSFKIKDTVLEPRSGRYQPSEAAKDTPPVPEQTMMMEVIRDSTVDAPLREEDVMTEATSRTDEDIVNEAFKHVGFMDDMDEDDDEDEIVWNPKATSPTISLRAQAVPMTPERSLGNTSGNTKAFPSPSHMSLSPKQQAALKTPIGSPRMATIPALTAQDLLNDVMNAGRRPSGTLVSTLDSPRMQPPLLFGSESTHQPITHSIWSASHDEQLLKFGGAPNQIQTSPRTYSHTLNPTQDISPSIWASQPMNGAVNGQFQHSGNMHQSNSYAPNGVGSLHHHRVPSTNSLTSNLSHYYGNLKANDLSIHASPIPQQAPLPPNAGTQALLFPQYQQHQPQHKGKLGLNTNQTFYDSSLSQARHLPSLQDPRTSQQHFMTSTPWGKNG